jgi:hypothetical protein
MLTPFELAPVLCSAIVAAALVATPFEITLDSQSLSLHAQSAWAKDGGNSGGKGGGNGNSNGGESGSGSGADGKGNNGKDGKNDNADKSGDEKGTTVNQSTPDTRENVEVDGSSIEVRHANGMSEKIEAGRYTMKDAKGRTIINRTATNSDQSRLQSFAR